MKVSKAIEILTEFNNTQMPKFPPDLRAAQKLGIEALKVVRSNRTYGYPNKIPKLPGETE